jgi:hypothetical protein
MVQIDYRWAAVSADRIRRYVAELVALVMGRILKFEMPADPFSVCGEPILSSDLPRALRVPTLRKSNNASPAAMLVFAHGALSPAKQYGRLQFNKRLRSSMVGKRFAAWQPRCGVASRSNEALK